MLQLLKRLQFSTTFSLIFLLCHTLHAAPLKTLSLDFTRELTENNKTEYIAGTLHYDVKTVRVVVEVKQPLQQIMVVKDNVLEIYYSVEKQHSVLYPKVEFHFRLSNLSFSLHKRNTD